MSAISVVPFDPFHHQSALLGTFSRAFLRSDDEAIRTLIRQELDERHRYLVAVTAENAVMGFVSWVPRGEPRHRLAELYHISVDPLRKKIRGVGQLLVAGMEESAHRHFRQIGFPGCRKVVIYTHTTNDKAHHLYARCGYTLVATVPSFFHEGVDEDIFAKDFS